MPWRERSYEVLPALSVRRGELRRSMRIAIFSWMYGSAWAVMVSGVQLKTFGRLVGFTDFHFGLLAAAPPLASCFMIFAALLIERSGLRKYQFLQCGTVHRLLWLGVATVPLLLPVPSRLAVVFTLAIIISSWVLHAFAAPAWMTWMGALVPRRIRGRFFASRFRFGRVIQVMLVVTIGVLLEVATVPGAPETADAQPALLYTIMAIFAVAAVLGASEILMYRKVRDILQEPVETRTPQDDSSASQGPTSKATGLLRAVASPITLAFADRGFRRYIYYAVTITFASAVPGFFFWVYTTEVLGFSKLAAQVLYMAIGPIVGFFGLRVWGKLIDRWGRRPVLMVATGMTVFSAMPYFFSTPHTPWPAFLTTVANACAEWIGPWVGRPGWVWITPDMPVGAYLVVMTSILIGSIGWTGVMMGQNNIVMGFADTQGRSRFVAASMMIASLGAIIGAPIGGAIVSALERAQFEWHVGPFIWTRYHATFAMSMLGRLAALLLLIRMPDPGSGKFREMIRYIGLVTTSNVSGWFLYPFRLFRGRRASGKQRLR